MDIDVVLRTSLLLAATGIVARLLPNAAPSTRHLLWNIAIALVLLAPVVAPLAPTYHLPMSVPSVRTLPEVPEGLVPKVVEESALIRNMPGTLGTAGVGLWLAAIADEDAQVREKAAIALGASGDPRAVAALQKATTDPDSQVREKAVQGLVLFGLRQ